MNQTAHELGKTFTTRVHSDLQHHLADCGRLQSKLQISYEDVFENIRKLVDVGAQLP